LLPESVKTENSFLKKYFKDKKACYICDLVKNELKDNKRIIHKDSFFIIASLFFSNYYFEVNFIPIRHMGCFEEINSAEKEILAKYLKKISAFFLEKFGGNMNLFIKMQPINENNSYYYHWTLKYFQELIILGDLNFLHK